MPAEIAGLEENNRCWRKRLNLTQRSLKKEYEPRRIVYGGEGKNYGASNATVKEFTVERDGRT